MVIEITGPIFKCVEDENIFFERIYALPGYEAVVGRDRNLYLTIKNWSGKEVAEELQEICNIWNISFIVVSE